MYLIIKYLKEDLAQLALLKGNALPPSPALSLAGKSRWLSVSAIFLQVWVGKGPRGWPAHRMEGSENKDGVACNISHRAASWNFIVFTRIFIHHTDSGLLFVSQARKGKVCVWGRAGGEMLLILSNCCLSASVTATKAVEL